MSQYMFMVFLVALLVFAVTMKKEPRTLWSGVLFLILLGTAGLFSITVALEYYEWLYVHQVVFWILVIIWNVTMFLILLSPVLLILTFFVQGIKVIRKEGMRPVNFLSVLFAVLLCAYLIVWPFIGGLGTQKWQTLLYAIISFAVVYLLILMAMYTLSAIVNLVHIRKKRNLDYIVVLGCGIRGKQVTPLLAGRIKKGIALLKYNPDAKLLLSGGQGPGEDIPESHAMASYAREQGVAEEKIIIEDRSVSTRENLLFSRELMEGENPRIGIVTTSYHVFRALILAKQCEISCIGFGAKTKWYFTLNAELREFGGYLSMTWKRHAVVVGAVSLLMLIAKIV